MTDRFTKLLADLDKAWPGPWEQAVAEVVSDETLVCDAGMDNEPAAQADAAHIARYDPTTVREMLELLRSIREEADLAAASWQGDYPGTRCHWHTHVDKIDDLLDRLNGAK